MFDDTCMGKNMVAQAMRHVIIDQFSTMVRLLGLDPSTPDDELWAEILRLCLFDRNRRINPSADLQHRLNFGDFLPVQPHEDPNNLRPGREPMDNDALDAAVERANADSVYWDGNPAAAADYIVRNIILQN